MKEEQLIEQVIIPEFFGNLNQITISKKTHKSIDFIPEHLLTKIHSDIKVAKELCLYFLSFITETMYETDNEETFTMGKNLLASNLAWYLRSPRRETKDTTIYQNIINALKAGTPDKGAFIIVGDSYMPGEFSRRYNLTTTYKCGIQSYTLKTKFVKDIVTRNTREKLIKAYTSPIAVNLIRLYDYLDLPTKEELLEKGKQLSKEGYTTKKGKILTMKYRKDKSYWKDADNRSFVEDDIELFEYYTSYGFMIPVIGDENCPRVYDSLSLMPSWIRNEIKFDGQKMYEADYKCLHPNLIMNIYKGSTQYITHKKVADDLGLDIKEVKTKHLSFFNLKANHLESSKLFKYYNNNEPLVISKVLEDKKIHGHKYTSKLLFTLETELMSKVINKLNSESIFVGYMFDALFVAENNVNKVIEVMNETALEMNIFTTADTNYIDSNESKLEINTNTLEVIENTPEETKIASNEVLITKKDYEELIEEKWYGLYKHRNFKMNKDRILNDLVKLQTKSIKQIKNKLLEL